MGITNKAILTKMNSELLLAIDKEKSNQINMLQHITKVHLLCELLLEEHALEEKEENILSMVNQQKRAKIESDSPQQSRINENDATSDSIFDF